MFIEKKQVNLNKIVDLHSPATLTRLTALWGFSEAALGGVLHALNIPFSGMIMSGMAVIFISLIANFSNQRGAIIKSTLIVMLVKGAVSPQFPIVTHIAVLLQGVIGQILFSTIRIKKVASLILGIIALVLSGFQKLIALTFIFGNTLWESIDIYTNYILKQLSLLSETSPLFRFSYLIIGLYLGFHSAVGILIGIYSTLLPKRIQTQIEEHNEQVSLQKEEIEIGRKRGKRKRWYQKPSGIVLIALFIIMMIISYFIPGLGQNVALGIIIMLVRSVAITTIWFYFLSPISLKFFRKILNKQRTTYSKNFEEVVNLLPHLKAVARYSWEKNSAMKGFKKIRSFLILTLSLSITLEFPMSDN